MSMEEFIRGIETNPSAGLAGTGGSGSPNELITHKKWRKVKNPKTGEMTDVEEVDIDSKTVLTSPTSFTVVEAFLGYLDETFGKRNNTILREFKDRFKINMPNKDGLAREQFTRALEGQRRTNAEEEDSLLKRISKM